MRKVSYNPSKAKPGDLFFYHNWDGSLNFKIVVKTSPVLLVYHWKQKTVVQYTPTKEFDYHTYVE